MANIPSTYTFEEVLHFYSRELSDDILSRAWEYVQGRIELEKELEQQWKYIECIEEQLYFRNEWIEGVVREAEASTKVEELRAFIKTSLTNSFIEL